jgi:2-hydroxychromene-2-carboxylate isomerase
MGDVISLHGRRRAPGRGDAARAVTLRGARTTFWFDLALPETYLAAERVDRLFADVRWLPASLDALHAGARLRDPAVRETAMAEAADRATALSVPLVWPHPFPAEVGPAMRAAGLACELGRGAAFVLAASRLAFCGGFDLADPEVLAETAAAAGIPLDACLEAAGDRARDGAIDDEGRRLLAMGADRLPALRVGRVLFAGEERLSEAAAAARSAESDRLRRPAAG